MRPTTIAALAALAAAPVLAAPAVAQGDGRARGDAPATDGAVRASAETGAANAPDQEPAFAGQTRAPQPADDTAVRPVTVVDGLPRLWALEFLPDGRMLVTTKAGAMHVIAADGTVSDPLGGVPEVDARGQGGLLDVALAPDFADSDTIVFSYAEPREDGGNGTTVARATLDAEAGALSDVAVIFRQTPAYDGTKHYGSRLAFRPDGTLFVTVGERSDSSIRGRAQDLSAGMGKVFRINLDGTAPADNPFVGDDDAQPEIWSYGHRNIQSAVVAEDGSLWTVEHGPRGGDELNRPEAGVNHGWPVISYGVEYGGQPIGDGITAADGMAQPVYYWDPVIAPSGMAQYTADRFADWQGAILVGGLETMGLVVLGMEDGRVASEERVSLGARVRDVTVGSDGFVYAVTESGGGSAIVRIEPGNDA